MTVLRIPSMLASLLLLVVVTVPAWSALCVENQSLYHALWPDHDPKLVIAGRITAEQGDPGAITGTRGRFSFAVTSVILGDQAYRNQVLTIEAGHLLWPEALVPFRVKDVCILVLGSDRQGKPHVCSVVPTLTDICPTVTDGEAAKRILAGGIIFVLAAEKSPQRQAELIIQAAPILTPAEARVLEPFTRHEDPWVRRAALATLIFFTADPGLIREAAADIDAFVTVTSPTLHVHGRPDLLRHYFFLERSWHAWSEVEREQHRRLRDALLQTGLLGPEARKLIAGE